MEIEFTSNYFGCHHPQYVKLYCQHHGSHAQVDHHREFCIYFSINFYIKKLFFIIQELKNNYIYPFKYDVSLPCIIFSPIFPQYEYNTNVHTHTISRVFKNISQRQELGILPSTLQYFQQRHLRFKLHFCIVTKKKKKHTFNITFRNGFWTQNGYYGALNLACHFLK